MNIRSMIIKSFLVFIFFCSAAMAANAPKYGTLDANATYHLTVSSGSPFSVSFYVPINPHPFGNRKSWLDIKETIGDNSVYVGFTAKYLHGAGVFFIIHRNDDDFSGFVKYYQNGALENYGMKKSSDKVELIHSEKTQFQGHPAVYNVYKMSSKKGELLAVNMQYLIEYGPHLVNLEYQARETSACMEPLKDPQLAINKTFAPANRYFDSFKLSL